MSPDEKTTGTADTEAQQAKVAADLEQLFRGAMQTAQKSIEQYTEYAIKASKRVVKGEGDNDDWSKDAAELGALWLKDVSNAWSTWAQAVNLLAGRSATGNAKDQGGG